jgi:hypothetical protein
LGREKKSATTLFKPGKYNSLKLMPDGVVVWAKGGLKHGKWQ